MTTSPLMTLIAMLYQTNHGVLMRTVNGLTHADSLLQPPFKANCLNWVMGHIVTSRNRILRLVGEEPVMSADHAALYQRGSQPILEEGLALPFDDLVSAFDQSQRQLLPALQRLSEEQLHSAAEMLQFLAWHEGYHIGQTDLLRQLAGKGDQVIP